MDSTVSLHHMHDTNTQSGKRTIAEGDMATHTTDQHEHTRTVAAQCYYCYYYYCYYNYDFYYYYG